MNAKRRAVLFTNGEAEKPELLKLRGDDYLIAVDGGLRFLEALNLTADLLVGDLDSITGAQLQALSQSQTELLRFKVQKDFTDLELALDEAIRRGFTEIVIAFGLGGRLDHTLGNLSLLQKQNADKNLEISFDDGLVSVYLISDSISLSTKPDELISLIPWRNDATVHETVNLAYPLHDETLYLKSTRGISNFALADSVSVTMSAGEVLLIHTKSI